MKLNKKGFTIVELVIVIAVIAILAAVLIPTFSTVIENANRSTALQEAKVAMEVVSDTEDAKIEGKYYIVGEKYTFVYDADETGIVTKKPTKYADDKKQSDMITEYTGKIPASEGVEYYAFDKATAKKLAAEELNSDGTIKTEGIITNDSTVTANKDISKKVVVIGKHIKGEDEIEVAE